MPWRRNVRFEKAFRRSRFDLQHLNQTHRELDTTNNVSYNFNTLGLIRHAIPQFAKEGSLKGATITLITNGGTFSTLEFLSNAQAASNALQRLTEQKTTCDPEQCPPGQPTTPDSPSNAPLAGMDFIRDLALGRLLIKTEQTHHTLEQPSIKAQVSSPRAQYKPPRNLNRP